MDTATPNTSTFSSKSNQHCLRADVRTGITPRQLQILAVIGKLIRERVYSPSYSEIGREIGVTSQATVSKHLELLEKRGYITRQRYQERSITVTPAGQRILYNLKRREARQ